MKEMIGKNMVEKGFNSDVKVLDKNYHVQTEDWGRDNPFLVSRVFTNGAVVRSIKTSYAEILPGGIKAAAQDIRLAMKIQHNKILDLLISGQL